MTTLYKATRPDGTDFRTGTVRWVPPDGHDGEWVVRHPTAQTIGDDAYEYLSVSTDPTDLPGAAWPMRLHEVEAVGPTGIDPSFPHKVMGLTFRYVAEVPAHLRFGPMGEHVAALVARAARLTGHEVEQLGAAGDAAWGAAWAAAWAAARDATRAAARDAAWAAARDAAWGATRGAAWAAAWCAAWDAARVLVVRDLIGSHGFTQAHYDTLTGPWRSVIGPVHPDDKELP